MSEALEVRREPHAKGSLAIVLVRRLKTIGQTPIKETEINFQKHKEKNKKQQQQIKQAKKSKQRKKTNKKNTPPAPLHILEPPQVNFCHLLFIYLFIFYFCYFYFFFITRFSWDASLYLEFKFQRYRC